MRAPLDSDADLQLVDRLTVERSFRAGRPLASAQRIGFGRPFAVGPTELNGSRQKLLSLSAFGNPGLWQVTPDIGGREQITRPYEENHWVHAALKVLAEAASSVELVLWQSGADDAQPVPDSDDLRRLFRRPNPLMTWSTAMTAAMIHRKLHGEDFWFLADASGKPLKVADDGKIPLPAQMWPVRGAIVREKRMAQKVGGSEQAWVYQTSGGVESEEFPAGSVLHFRDYDPYNPKRGIGDVESLTRQMQLQFQAERYQEGVFRNSGDPGGFIRFKGKVQASERERLEQEARDVFGNPNAAGEWKVIDEDAEYVPNKLGPKDMEYSVLQDKSRDAILGVLGVPPPLVGVFDRMTYNNMHEAARMLWTGGNGVIPFLRSMADTFNSFFFPRLSEERQRKIVCSYDVGSIEALREDNTAKFTAAVTAVVAGVGMSMNESLAAVGVELEDLPFGDTHYVTPNLIPLDGAAVEALGDELDDDLIGEGVDPAAAPRSEMPADGEGQDGVSGEFLNGAQMLAIAEIVRLVAAGELPRDAGAAVLALLLKISEAEAEGLLGAAGTGEPTQPNKPEGGDEPTVAPAALPPEPPAVEEESIDRLRIMRREDRAAWKVALLRRLARRVREPGEAEISGASRKFLGLMRAAQLKRLADVARRGTSARGLASVAHEKQWTVDSVARALLVNRSEWEKKLAKLVGPKLASAYSRALAEAEESIGGPHLTIATPSVAEAIASQKVKLAEGVTSTLSRRVHSALTNVLLKEGANLTSLQQAVLSTLEDLKAATTGAFGNLNQRAMAIARTEAGKAISTARFEQMKEAGITAHEWVSSGDEDVRPSHEQVDGEIRVIGQRFSNGLRYPRDPDGPAEEVVNCRCDAAEVVEPEDIEIPGVEVVVTEALA